MTRWLSALDDTVETTIGDRTQEVTSRSPSSYCPGNTVIDLGQQLLCEPAPAPAPAMPVTLPIPETVAIAMPLLSTAISDDGDLDLVTSLALPVSGGFTGTQAPKADGPAVASPLI
jgi:hypothetical protein